MQSKNITSGKNWRKELDDYLFKNPDCKCCRTAGYMHILFTVGMLLTGLFLIYTMQDDLGSECCRKVKEYNERYAAQFDKSVAYVNVDKNNPMGVTPNEKLIYADDTSD